MEVYVVTWSTSVECPDDDDDGDDEPPFEIRAFGRTRDDRTAVIRVRFPPFFYVKVPGSEQRRRLFVSECVRDHGAVARYSLPVTRKDAWGYSAGADCGFVQLAFPTPALARSAKYRLARRKLETYESGVDPVIRLCHVRKLPPTGWVRVASWTTPDDPTFPGADLEIEADFSALGPAPEAPPAPLRVCSWDLECYSSTGAFPRAALPADAIVQVAMAFQRVGQEAPERVVVVCLGDTAPVEGVEIVSVATEAELLRAFFGLLAGVDIVVGWNTWQFDWAYVAGRLAVLNVDADVGLDALGRGGPGAGAMREWELNSGAYGQNSFSVLRVPGVLDLDLMQLVRRDLKLESYSLDNVSRQFLGDAKVDLPAREIFRKFLGSAEDRADIARYAVQDVRLPLRLMQKLSAFDNLTQMAVATCVPMDYLLTRGQQIRVYSLVLKQAREMGYLLPDDKGITTDGKYEGATVLEPVKGAYFDVVSGLDFASLYPSIIRAHNLCYSTVLLPGSPRPPEGQVFRVSTALGDFEFAQDVPGIVPELLKNLAAWRQAAKRRQAACKAAGDAWGASLWNGSQLAFKISANSVYGFMGASKGFLPCVPIAMAVTATGESGPGVRAAQHAAGVKRRVVPPPQVGP